MEISFKLFRSLNTTDFAKLGHSRQQGKHDAAVHGFQYAIERFQSVAESRCSSSFADSLEQGFVIFVDENGYTLTTLLIGPSHNSAKRKARVVSAERVP